jgi:hypothetical protein
MNVLTAVGPMKLETKFVRLKTPVTIGSLFGEWRVCGSEDGPEIGSPISSRIPGLDNDKKDSRAKTRTAGGAPTARNASREDLAVRRRGNRRDRF